MNVLVTGGTGFVGSYLVKRLLEGNHAVTALVRDSKRGEHLSRAGARLVEGDVSDRASCERAVKGMDAVYHCAALTGFWGISREQFYLSNVTGTENMLAACLKASCPNVVHVSTTFVYGPRKDGRILSETDAVCDDLFDYEQSKLESEQIAGNYARGKGLNVKTVRLTSVYGPEGRLIPSLVDGLVMGKLRIIGDGSNKKHITHVSDCVDGILAAAEKGRRGGLYIIGASEIPTMGEVVRMISNVLGVDSPKAVPRPVAKGIARVLELASKITKTPPHLTGYMVDYLSLNHSYDTRRAREELGFVPRIGFANGITTSVRQYLVTQSKQ